MQVKINYYIQPNLIETRVNQFKLTVRNTNPESKTPISLPETLKLVGICIYLLNCLSIQGEIPPFPQ